jgi:hypothetical protein
VYVYVYVCVCLCVPISKTTLCTDVKKTKYSVEKYSVIFSLDGCRERFRFVACVRPHVSGDHVPPTRRVRTLRTLVRLFPGVRPLVGG